MDRPGLCIGLDRILHGAKSLNDVAEWWANVWLI